MVDLGEIGRGGFGTVNKMVFKKNNKIMAVKRIRCSNVVDEKEQKRIMVSCYHKVVDKQVSNSYLGLGCCDEIIK